MSFVFDIRQLTKKDKQLGNNLKSLKRQLNFFRKLHEVVPALNRCDTALPLTIDNFKDKQFSLICLILKNFRHFALLFTSLNHVCIIG